MGKLKTKTRKFKIIKTAADRRALIVLLREHLEVNRKDTNSWYDLACCYDWLGREKEAEPCYVEVYKHWRAIPKKEQAGFFVGFGSTLRNNKKLKKSEAVLREGARRFPDFPALKIFLALTLYTKKDFKNAALTLFKFCLEMPDKTYAGYEKAIKYYINVLG